MMHSETKYYREVTPLAKEESFVVMDRIKTEFDFPMHFHPEIELNFIENAAGAQRVVGDHVEEIGSLELVLVGSNLQHCWQQGDCKSQKIREITIQFGADLFAGVFLQKRVMSPLKDLFDRAANGILFSQETIQKLKPELLLLSNEESMQSFLRFLNLLYELAISEDQRQLSTFVINEEQHLKDPRMKTISDYIAANFSEKIMLEEMAEMVSMSIPTFNRFIKRQTGNTFINYLNDIRIGFAARWLIETNMNISEIAFNAGFNNISNFNRIFRKSKGATPSDYRMNYNGLKKFM